MKIESYYEIDKYSKKYGYLYVLQCQSDKGTPFQLMTHTFSPKPVRLGKIQQLTYFQNKNMLTHIIRDSKANVESVERKAIGNFEARQKEIANAKALRDEADKTREPPATQEEITNILDQAFEERGWERGACTNWYKKATDVIKSLKNSLKS